MKNLFNFGRKKTEPNQTSKDIYYREDGGKWKVKLLSDIWNGDMRIIELQCIEQFHPHMMGDIPPGNIFSASCLKGHEAYVGWSLKDEDGYDVCLKK